MSRVKLKYTRRKVVEEHGYVMVDVPPDSTMADAYRAAHEQDWAQKLPEKEDVVKDDWDFFTSKRPDNVQETA